MSEEKARVHLTISGHVQGVFFRKSSQNEAKSLLVTGWVKNRADGTVELVAEGQRKRLERLIDWCRHGPSRADVDQLEITWEDYMGEFDSFEIRYS